MRFLTEQEAVQYIFKSQIESNWRTRGLDEESRSTLPTQKLLQAHGLLATRREYTVVTGSKGKGSVSAMTAHLLKQLGHRVGMVTNPHLISYRERIRVNGQAIPPADFLRLVDYLSPSIDSIIETQEPHQYLSPQGILLAMALKYFDEQGVTAAIIEVGRGGRYDDSALVPNMLSLFTPVVLEHARYLGPTVERIAWHKAGIIKPHSYAYSLPQSPEVMDILRAEAESQDATFEWIMPMDLGEFVSSSPDGIRARFDRYGEVKLPFLGRYEIENASLAIVATGNMHARLGGIAHRDPEYVERIRHGLETVVWPGRCQRLQSKPDVYVDTAVNPHSLKLLLASLRGHIKRPLVTVTAVPLDREIETVYKHLIAVSDALILTTSVCNDLDFPTEPQALATARKIATDTARSSLPIRYEVEMADAIEAAIKQAGTSGTVLITAAAPAVGDALEHYRLSYEQI